MTMSGRKVMPNWRAMRTSPVSASAHAASAINNIPRLVFMAVLLSPYCSLRSGSPGSPECGYAGLVGLYIYATALLAIGIYPMILLDTVRVRPTRAWLYAKYTVPQLISATAVYALPLLLHYSAHIEFDTTQLGSEINASL